MATNLLPLRKLSRILKVPSSSSSSFRKYSYLLETSIPLLDLSDKVSHFHPPTFSRSFCSRSLDFVGYDYQGPATIDYGGAQMNLALVCCSSLMQEGEFHRLADSTIHGLQEKLEEYGDDLQMDRFDVDYGGPSRFDWDQNSQAWIYRRNKSNLLRLLETELAQLCGDPIDLFSLSNNLDMIVLF